MSVQDIISVFIELNGFPCKMHVFRKMQFVSHCYTVVLCQQISRNSVNKNSAVYLRMQGLGFCLEIRDLGSPTTTLLQLAIRKIHVFKFTHDYSSDLDMNGCNCPVFDINNGYLQATCPCEKCLVPIIS